MYTAKELEILLSEYEKNPSPETIDLLVEKLQKPKKSIIGKLSREGVYQKQVYTSKTGETPITKKELVYKIATKLSISPEEIEGLEKSPKLHLKKLLQCLN